MDHKRCSASAREGKREPQATALTTGELDEAIQYKEDKPKVENQEELDPARQMQQVPFSPVRRVDLVGDQKGCVDDIQENESALRHCTVWIRFTLPSIPAPQKDAFDRNTVDQNGRCAESKRAVAELISAHLF